MVDKPKADQNHGAGKRNQDQDNHQDDTHDHAVSWATYTDSRDMAKALAKSRNPDFGLTERYSIRYSKDAMTRSL